MTNYKGIGIKLEGKWRKQIRPTLLTVMIGKKEAEKLIHRRLINQSGFKINYAKVRLAFNWNERKQNFYISIKVAFPSSLDPL